MTYSQNWLVIYLNNEQIIELWATSQIYNKTLQLSFN